jgi:hypothetical protein
VTVVDRLYDLLPLVDRMRDDGALRDFLRVIAEQVGVVEDDIARLYDNWFVETADDSLVPYIGELVGSMPIPATGPWSARADVAGTIARRRRKGTRALLDDVARDIAGRPGRAVEMVWLLAYAQHVNHLRPTRGRVVDVRAVEALERLDTPHDEVAHRVDVRRVSSRRTPGRYNIPSVALFLWRLGAYPVTRTPAAVIERVGRWAFTFDTVGFDTQLFSAAGAPVGRREFEVTDDDGNRHVAAEHYGVGRSLVVWAPDWPRHGEGRPVPVDRVIPADLGDWDTYRARPGTVAVDPVRGRLLFPRREPPKRVYVSYHYGFSADLGGGEYDRPVAPVAEGTWVATAEDTKGLRKALDAWRHDKPATAVIELVDSDVYAAPVDVAVRSHQSLTIRSANRVRAVLWLPDRRSERPDVFTAAVAPGGELVLDGLVVAGHPVRVEGWTPEEGEEEGDDGRCAGPTRVVVRHCTLVPGWLPRGRALPETPPPPALELVELPDARVEVRHSIVGTVQVLADAHEGDPLRLDVADSILDATGADLEAVGGAGPGAGYAVARIVRSTVLGRVHVHAVVLGENSIFDGVVKVARRGIGCLRFCSVVPGSRTPRQFRCVTDPPPRFTSTSFADAGYAQLSCSCPPEIAAGADDESEMGAFHDLYQPQRLAGLRLRAEEHTPAGMDVAVVPVT